MSFAVCEHNDICVIDVEGQLVVGNRQELKDRMIAELERGERKFLIDFDHTDYIDSSGIGALISLSRRIHTLGGELRLANLNADLQMLFELTKLDTYFKISPTREAALSTF